MELKTLLNNQGWDESDLDFSDHTIGTEIRSSVGDRIKDLFYQYNKIIFGNLFFLVLFSSVWFIVPVWETLIPIGIIATCYLYMIGSVIFNRWRYDKPDPTLPLPELIRSMLAYNKQILKQLGNSQAIIMSACGLAGAMIGLLLQLGTLDILFNNPIGIASMVVIPGIIYFLAKRGLVSSLNRAFNPGYFKVMAYLKEQLAELELDED
jgi:hypothetical protein